jgi:non-heme chloroperoxidase
MTASAARRRRCQGRPAMRVELALWRMSAGWRYPARALAAEFAMSFTIQSVEVSRGIQLQCVEQGDPSGIPTILLHGVTDSWRSFERVLPYLPGSIRAFAVTQRGHGDASRPAAGYRTRDFGADVAGFVQALELGPVVLVGHSMGSTHALRFAIDHPELTLGAVLVAAFASYGDNAVFTEFGQLVSRLVDPIDPAFVREFQESTLAQPIPPEFLDTAVRESLKLPARVWRALFAGFLEDDFAGELRRVTSPTLMMWGDRDTFVRRSDQDVLLRSIEGSRLIVYEGAGHALHWEEPSRFGADLSQFVTTLTNESRLQRRPTRS